MRVLHINDYPLDHPAAGGCEVSIDTVVKALRRRGIEVGEFTGGDVSDQRRSLRRYVSNPAARAAVRDRIRSFAPDVVHLHNFYHVLSPGILGVLAACRRERPIRVVMTAHDGHLLCPNSGLCEVRGGDLEAVDPAALHGIGPLLTKRWDHRSLAHSMAKVAQHLWSYRLHRRQRVIDLVICPSRFLCDLMAAHDLPARHLPNPVSPSAPPVRKPTGPLRLVFAGHVSAGKGLAGFLEALPASFDGVFTVVGDGGDLARCQAICADRGLGDRVEFLGRRSPEASREIIGRAHALILPSRWYENAPVSLIEALSQQTNIVVSNLGGMKETVDTLGVGYTFDVRDAASIAATLASVEGDHRAGRLNAFDVSDELRRRNEDVYVQVLLELYRIGSLAQAA